MDILIMDDGTLVHSSESIGFGKLDASEPGVEKFKVGDTMFYLPTGLTLVRGIDVPQQVTPYKHRYVNGVFSLNPNWNEPVTVESLQQQITEMQLALATLAEGGAL